MFHRIPQVRAFALTAVLASVALLSACGGGDDNDVSGPSETDQLISVTVPGYPNPVNVYKPKGATRAIVALHGGGGDYNRIAYQLGLNSLDDGTVAASTVNWSWLEANHVMFVFPQGLSIPGQEGATTWSNRVMNSGQDDVKFLAALATKIRSDYSVTKVTLMGHSMGGAMTNRMYCESNATFDSYVSLAGPASVDYAGAVTCDPVASAGGKAVAPYMGIIGDTDPVMQTYNKVTGTSNWGDDLWSINKALIYSAGDAWVNDQVINEQVQQQVRATAMCGGTGKDIVAATPTNGGYNNNVDTWTNCDGRLVLKRIHGAGHGVTGVSPIDGTPSMANQMGFSASGSFSNGLGLVGQEEELASTAGLK